ncbi:interleukin-13 receptor subunit alpha-2 isoform X2 [Clupea harengus]|uniref:Interleukin-13 receptor subunit alpha-2 isoform X2 n=1 Tax=Clupea harengus TaxID=7950 RepID=A0A6P8FXM8_CLUHA|nr:interleukin-13 receptor subunit alpha-2 isoform X2 [Clupea harengus]
MKMFSVILAVIMAYICRCCAEVKSVEPPENVTVSGLGLLGQLVIHWSRPTSLQNVTDCAVRYQLEYFSTYKNEWKGYRTPWTTLRAQFDLERDVQVKLRTMLRGKCTNGIESTSAALELVWHPKLTGVEGSRVKNFSCVFHMKQYMECTWDRGPEEPQHSQRFLYYWHNGLEAVAECPQYLLSSGVRTGCLFPREAVKEFTDFNVCVNGSSPVGPLRPAYFSLQVQNHVKPGLVEAVSLEALQQDGELVLGWKPPAGHIPSHCLEYEVMTEHTNQDGREWRMVNVTEDTSLVLPANQRSCARVRSHVHRYCSDHSFWSNWTQWKCLPEKDNLSPAMDIALICVLVASAVALLSLCVSVGMFSRTRRQRTEQKVSHCSLLGENQHLKLLSAFSHPHH